jgi:hypothetical protein
MGTLISFHSIADELARVLTIDLDGLMHLQVKRRPIGLVLIPQQIEVSRSQDLPPHEPVLLSVQALSEVIP